MDGPIELHANADAPPATKTLFGLHVLAPNTEKDGENRIFPNVANRQV